MAEYSRVSGNINNAGGVMQMPMKSRNVFKCGELRWVNDG